MAIPGTTAPRRGHLLRWSQRLACIALGSTLAMVLAEVTLRAGGWADRAALATVYDFFVDDGQGAAKPRPGYRGTKIVEGRRIPIVLDGLGLRGEELGPRRAGDRLVLCLGDSMVFGHGVTHADAYPARLAPLLTQSLGRPVLCANGGLPGNSFGDQVRDLRRLAKAVRPDLVIAALYTANDFSGEDLPAKATLEGYALPGGAVANLRASLRARLALRLRTAWLAEHVLQRTLPGLALDAGMAVNPVPDYLARLPDLTQDLFFDRITPTPQHEQVLAALRRALLALRAEAGEARLLVLVLPGFVTCWPGLHTRSLELLHLDPRDYAPGRGGQRVAELCRSEGVPCVDMTPVFRAQPAPAELFLPTDLHLAPAGHELVARTVAVAATRWLH